MARTKQSTGGFKAVQRKNVRPSREIKKFEDKFEDKFELIMCKYYPKKTRLFYKDFNYQASDAGNYENANSRVLQRYKRSFFRSFAADASQPSKIPNNLRTLKIIDESTTIFLRKLIKQNKRLEHIVIASEDEDFNANVIKYLKYSKSLRSIMFYFLPYFSQMMGQKMLKTWGKTLEIFTSLGSIDSQYRNDGESFKRAMETILKFPKLKDFELKSSVDDAVKYFPFEKLQERNIAYEIVFAAGRNTFRSLKRNSPQFEPAGLVVVEILEGRLGDNFRQYSNQTLVLQRETHRDFQVFVLPVFQNIIALDISIIGIRWDVSDMGQLNSLKHLAINLIDDGCLDIFGDLFKYLNKNVAPHKKLETFMINLCSIKDRKQERKSQGKAILKFFGACSESLRKVHLEFEDPNDELIDPDNFCEGLNKLKNLQSLTLIRDFNGLNAKKRIETICAKISEIKSLEELTFKIRKEEYQKEIFNLKFPPQLKSLSLGMDTASVLFNASKALWPLKNLTHLELDFVSFSTQKWKNIIKSALDKLKLLKTFHIISHHESRDIKNGFILNN